MADTSFDIIVVGGGPGGYVAAIRAAQLGMKTAVVEREHMGGICLNWGCIPTKALLRTSEVYGLIKHADAFGLSVKDVSYDPKKIVERSRKVANQLSNGVKGLMKKNKITVFDGTAKLAGVDGGQRKLAVAMNDKSNRDAHRQERDPGDRRAGAPASRPGVRRQARLDLQGSDGAAGVPQIAAGDRLRRDRHRVRELLSHHGRGGDGGRGGRPHPARRGRGGLGLRQARLREAGHEDPDRRHGRRPEEGQGQRHRHDHSRRQEPGDHRRSRDQRRRHRRQCREPGSGRHQGEGREDPHRDRPVGLHRRAERLCHRRCRRPAVARAQGHARGRAGGREDRRREGRASDEDREHPGLHLLPAAGCQHRAHRSCGQGQGLGRSRSASSPSSATARRSRSASPRASSRPSSTPRPASFWAPT